MCDRASTKVWVDRDYPLGEIDGKPVIRNNDIFMLMRMVILAALIRNMPTIETLSMNIYSKVVLIITKREHTSLIVKKMQ